MQNKMYYITNNTGKIMEQGPDTLAPDATTQTAMKKAGYKVKLDVKSVPEGR